MQCAGSASESGRSAPLGRGGAPAPRQRRYGKWRRRPRGRRRAAPVSGQRRRRGRGPAAPRRAAGAPLRPVEDGGGSAARLSGPQPRAPSPAVSSTRSPARRPTERRGPASNAAGGTDEQHSAAAAPPPLCDTAYQSFASAHVALQSARVRAGDGGGAWPPDAGGCSGAGASCAFRGGCRLGEARMLALYY